MSRFAGRVFLLLVSLGIVSCGLPQYTAYDLEAKGAKEIQGVVSKEGRGTFLLTDSTGVENKYCTGQMTQYIPPDYRSQEGDTVRVAFSESIERSGKTKRTVLQLESVAIPEKNKALPHISGEIVSTGRGSSRHSLSIVLRDIDGNDSFPIYIRAPSAANSMLNYREDLVGKEISVDLRRVPIFRGNAYIYETVNAQWITN